MSKHARIRVKKIADPVLKVERTALKAKRLDYLLVANRPLRYGKQFSRIVYVGTTTHGLRRIASSAASRAEEALKLPGVTRVEAFVLHCNPRRHVKTWRVLERGILLAFREAFANHVPKLNIQGKRIREKGEFKIYSRSALIRIVKSYP
jgi:hypothetical protein